MLPHVLCESTKTNAGEEVNAETSVSGMVFGEHMLSERENERIVQFITQPFKS